VRAESTLAPPRGPGRPREFDLHEALDKAVAVFGERGYHGTSIADLADAMELTAGSIYKAFKDKRAVFLAALDHQTTQRNAELQQALARGRTGRDKLREALAFYARLSCGASGRQGCLVVGTAMELASFDAEIAAHVTGLIKRREKLLAELVKLGQADGSVAKSADVKATARFMLCLLQGLRVVGKLAPSRDEMLAVVDVAMGRLG